LTPLKAKCSPEAIDLLHRLLELDPKLRISAIDAMRHSYFDNLRPQDRLTFEKS